jgi:hypothetical protein
MIHLHDFIIKKEDFKSTRKLYRMTCDRCGTDRAYQRMRRHGSGLCKACSSSVAHKNKVVSIKTKQKMSINHHMANGGTHPLLGKKHKQETKAKLSKSASEQNKRYKGNYTYSGLNKSCGMRSSWEVAYANWLDANKIGWEYEPTFKLSDGRLFTPDFKLECGLIIEIKGYFREDAMVKWTMFCEEYPDIKKQILMKKDLKLMGVL